MLFCAACGASGCSGKSDANANHSCPLLFCDEPAEATGPDGETYRGLIYPDVTVASDPVAQSVADPPVATLTFGGGEVETSDAGCKDVPTTAYQVQIFVGSEDASMDASGTLHAHSAPRDGYFASGPSLYLNESTTLGWAVDLSVTADGWMTATLSSPQPNSPDGGGVTRRITISGPLQCAGGRIPVGGGGSFALPCGPSTGCP